METKLACRPFINDRSKISEALEYVSWCNVPRRDIVLVNFEDSCAHCGGPTTRQEWIEPTWDGLVGSQEAYDILTDEEKARVLQIASQGRANAKLYPELEAFISKDSYSPTIVTKEPAAAEATIFYLTVYDSRNDEAGGTGVVRPIGQFESKEKALVAAGWNMRQLYIELRSAEISISENDVDYIIETTPLGTILE